MSDEECKCLLDKEETVYILKKIVNDWRTQWWNEIMEQKNNLDLPIRWIK